uniref:IQ and ubiquitin-like domain-containing protein n=1 Tax=Cacopsylla melanoneura TaxID=428564 RepID=A0A8D8TX22_9HEMI
MEPTTIAPSLDSMLHHYEDCPEGECPFIAQSSLWGCEASRSDLNLLSELSFPWVEPGTEKSKLKQGPCDASICEVDTIRLDVLPSENSSVSISFKQEDVETNLLETIHVRRQTKWNKVQLNLQPIKPSWFCNYYIQLQKQTGKPKDQQTCVERLMYPSEEEFNYKVNISGAEADYDKGDVFVCEEVYNNVCWKTVDCWKQVEQVESSGEYFEAEAEDSILSLQSSRPSNSLTGIDTYHVSTISLTENPCLDTLMSFIELGIEIENKDIKMLIQPTEHYDNYDLEVIVNHNARVRIKNTYHLSGYPIDRTERNPSELRKCINKLIEAVIALNPPKRPHTLDFLKFIRDMKPYVRQVTDKLETSQDSDENDKLSGTSDISDASLEKCQHPEHVTGYRNKTTNIKYYHACTQTMRYLEKQRTTSVSRDAQTPVFPLLDKTSSTMKTVSTQMEREGYYMDESNDRFICPQTYQKTIPGNEVKRIMVVRIQRTWREYLIAQTDHELRALIQNLQNEEEKKRYLIEQSAMVRQMMAMLSPMYLNRREDFHMLYMFLDNWWQNRKANDDHTTAVCILRQHKRISCDDCTTTQASTLLKTEYDEYLRKLIEIENLASEAKRSSFVDRQDLAELNESAKPLIVPVKQGAPIQILTLDAQRGAHLKDLYEELCRRDQPVSERINFLHNIKQFLLHENKHLDLTEKLLRTITKEIDYLMNFIKPDQIETLRQKTELFFLKYIRFRDINPNMNKILDRKYPPDCGPKLGRCSHCLKVKTNNAFETECFSKRNTICKSCYHIYSIGNKIKDCSQYTHMLKCLRQAEIKYCTCSPVPFLINEATVHYLVYNIWNAMSPISNCTHMDQLWLVRWIVHLDWTPWNNILLTQAEYERHVNIKHVNSFYSSTFIRTVELKNKRARMYFDNLYKLEYAMKSIYWLGRERQEPDQTEVEECTVEN